MSEIILSNDNFENEVLNSTMPVLVDFWASWCGPCKALGPIISEIAEEYSNKVKVCKLNVDENMALAQSYKIMSIPTVLLFKDGQVAATSVGLVSKEKLVNMFAE